MSSIDGLVSGMNTSAIISQLMGLERQPVARLEIKKLMADKAVTALQDLNTKFLAIADLAKKLAASANWSPVTATPSHADNVSVTVAPGTSPTSLSFKVVSLSAAHQIYSASSYATSTEQVATAGTPIAINYTDANGAAATLNVTSHDGTLSSIAAAINAETTSPVTARVVKTTDAGGYRLEFTAKKAGAASAFTVTGIAQPPGADMAFSVSTAASDAAIELGSSGTPLTITSASNTLTDVVPGVTLTLRKADPATTVTVDIARDVTSMAGDVEKLVEAANAFLTEAKKLTSYDATAKTSGLLQGNRTVRDLMSSVLQAVSSAVGGKTASTAGLQLTREGTLKFDKATFETAYAADPAAITALFTGPVGFEGVAQRLATLAETATKATDGILTQAIASRRSEIKRIDDSIAVWDVRLDRKEAALRRQYAALEKALGAAQQQGNWLAGQIASLPKPE